MLSQTLEYALRAAAFLARGSDTARTVEEIAAATRVPSGYLAKVLGQLARAGVVRSQRGLGGGFALARPPDEIAILEVSNAVDPIQRIERCPLGLPEHARALCALHQRLDEALATVETSFRDSSIADLVAAPARRGDPPAWPPPQPAKARRARSRKQRRTR
jgi:Rrf2 family transcriptional regulator, nitric oxide-sensitive transcriptional repressor